MITPNAASRNGYGSAALPADAETVALQGELPGHSGGITHIHAGRPNFLMATDIVKAFRWTTLMLALDLNLGTELSPPTPAETGVS